MDKFHSKTKLVAITQKEDGDLHLVRYSGRNVECRADVELPQGEVNIVALRKMIEDFRTEK